MEDLFDAPSASNDSPEETQEADTDESDESQKNLMAEELERVKSSKYSQKEKLKYTLKRVQAQLHELGEDDEEEDDDNRPLTVGEWKKLQQEASKSSELDYISTITDPVERELTKHHLENTIKPSGDPEADFKAARTLANSIRTQKIMEEAARKPKAKTHSGASSAPPKREEDKLELTKDEQILQRWGGLTDEEVRATRPKN